MRMVLAATGFGLMTISPLAAQTPNVQQLLQGLTTGNQSQDQGLRDAFERGYQKGRQDEAQQRRSDRGGSDRGGNDRGGNDRSSNDRSYRQGPSDDSRSYNNGDQGSSTYRR